MENAPIVSIILPTYNGSRYIDEAIQSILGQTYSNWELIIVDDASTDETPEIIRRYQDLDSRIRIITNQKNIKLPASLNIGHKVSLGNFITWTSDDNFYRENAIERMVSLLLEKKDVGMAYTDYFVVDSENNVITKKTVSSSEQLSEYNCIGACFLYRRSVYEKTGSYSQKMMFVEDYDYWLRIASHYPVVPIHEPLYYYRKHVNSLTSQVKAERIKKTAEAALAQNLAAVPWLTKEQKYNKMVKIMRHALAYKDFRRIPVFLLSAFIISPKCSIKSFLSMVLHLQHK